MKIEVPKNVKVGDIIVAKYEKSNLNYVSWEDYHHAALVSEINPLKIIEAVGGEKGDREGVKEVLFSESRNFGQSDSEIEKIVWLKPKFPKVIREKKIWWEFMPEISEIEARQKAVDYARQQIGEPYSIDPQIATKNQEKVWYCSLLIFKSYSRTVANMYLESKPLIETDDEDGEIDVDEITFRTCVAKIKNGPMVTPEDLVKSTKTIIYHEWKK